MKNLFLITAILFALNIGSAYAQTDALLEVKFWESHPDLASVKAEVEKGFDFKSIKGTQDPVVLAIRNDAPVATIKYLLDQPGIDLSHLVYEGRTYLHLAAYGGNAQAVDVLLDRRLDMYSLDSNGHTALTYAGFQGKLTKEVIDVFLRHGLDIHKKYETKDGANILLLSIPYDKDLVVTDYLLSKGLSLKTTDNDGNTAFNYAAKTGDITIMKELLKRGGKYNENALIIASQGTYRTANTIEVYKYLVDDLKINPKVVSQTGQNVLHSIAHKRAQTEAVKYFLDKGVDVNQVDNGGNTPFMNATGGQNFEVVELMFPHFNIQNINVINAEGKSALQAAVESGSGKTVSLLLKNGADVNVTDKEGNTLTYYLIESYRVPRGGRGPRGGDDNNAQLEDFNNKINALRDADLDFSVRQHNGMTIYHLAAAKNNLPLLKSIVKLNIDVNIQDNEGTTALHKAAMVAGNDTILKYLLSIGAKKDIKTEFDETAYSLAKENELLTKNNVSIDFLK